jgi:hypothetical protein
MKKFNLEKPDAVFVYAPVVEDVCIEFGIDRTDAETITCMYEVFKRMNGSERVDWDEDTYNEGYKDGYNDAIDEANCKIEGITWDLDSLKKK